MVHAQDVEPRSIPREPARTGPQLEPAVAQRRDATVQATGASAAERLRAVASVDRLGPVLARAVSYRYPPGQQNHVELIYAAVRAAERRIAEDVDLRPTKHDKGWKPMTDLELANAIVAIRASPIDYGLIDLEDEQHTEALYYYLRKQVRRDADAEADKQAAKAVKDGDKPYVATGVAAQEEEAREIAKEAQRRRDVAEQAIAKQNGADNVRVVDLAYVGAGAAVAYHVATRGRNENHSDALIIGESQPWREQRGPGLVGHPSHMISPMIEFLEGRIDDEWLARADLSDLIDEVLLKSLIPRWYSVVTGVSRGDPATDGHDYYRLELKDGRVVFSRRVVFGAGTGAHSRPRSDATAVAADEDEVEAKRVMDMDIFMRIADRLVKTDSGIKLLPKGQKATGQSEITLILVGPNAGIDVAFEALRQGYKVIWIAETYPAFLPGMGNAATQLAYVRALEGQVPKKMGDEPVAPEDLDLDALEKRMQALYAPGTGSENIERYKAEVLEKFVNSTLRLEAIHLKRFAGARADGTGVTASMDKAPDVHGDLCVYALGQTLEPATLLQPLPPLVPITDDSLRFGDKREATALGEASADGTLVVLGAAAAGHLRPPRPQPGQKAADHPMLPIVNSLPLNVAAPDQLTPVRSAVTAATEHMPSNVSREANFITDDRTTIAVHISARYPRLADRPYMPEIIAAAIIKSRRETAPWRKFTAEPPHGPRFQDHWRRTLALLASKS